MLSKLIIWLEKPIGVNKTLVRTEASDKSKQLKLVHLIENYDFIFFSQSMPIIRKQIGDRLVMIWFVDYNGPVFISIKVVLMNNINSWKNT